MVYSEIVIFPPAKHFRRRRIYYWAAQKKEDKNMEPREDVDDMIYCDDWFPSER